MYSSFIYFGRPVSFGFGGRWHGDSHIGVFRFVPLEPYVIETTGSRLMYL